MNELATRYTDAVDELEALRADLQAAAEGYGASDGMRAQVAARAADAVGHAIGALTVSGGVNAKRLARLG